MGPFKYLTSIAADGVQPFWVVVIGAIVSALTLGGKYLSDRLKSKTEIKIAENDASNKDMKINELTKRLEEVGTQLLGVSKELSDSRKNVNNLKSSLNVLTIKLTTITGVVKELAPDKPEIIRIVEKIENNNIIN